MNKKITYYNRRDFLKTSAGTAGALVLSGIGVGCAPVFLKRQSYKIFSPGQIGKLKIKNRLIRSATMVAAASGGNPESAYIKVHKKLAHGGVGLIITGFIIPTKEDARYSRQVNVYDDRHIKGLSKVADGVHGADNDCRLFAQIGHSGETEGPSGIKWPSPYKRKGRRLTIKEIEGIVTDFADAIWRVKESGFDGVELHGAHAYLLSSFLSPYTNRRTDRYGGSLKKRALIIRDIMDRARDRVGQDFPIIIKLNSDDDVPGGITPADFPGLATEIVKTGVDAIDVSGNDCMQPGISSIEEETYFLNGAEKANVKVPVIVTGGNRTVEHMEKILRTGEVSFFGLARPLIREPDLPDRWLKGKGSESATCISCNGCFGAIIRGEQAYCVQDA